MPESTLKRLLSWLDGKGQETEHYIVEQVLEEFKRLEGRIAALEERLLAPKVLGKDAQGHSDWVEPS